MKRDDHRFPRFIHHLKRKMVSFLEVDLSQGNPQNFSLHVIGISQFEKGLTELPVPTDAVQKLVDRYHLQFTAVQRPARSPCNHRPHHIGGVFRMIGNIAQVADQLCQVVG